jgi:hypothetical protein
MREAESASDALEPTLGKKTRVFSLNEFSESILGG